MSFEYKPTPTGNMYHDCDAFIKLITGPFGSGKSTIVAMDALYYAMAQTPAPPDGQGRRVRYSRVGVIRGSYPSLTSTTRKTLLEVMPEGYGHITMGNAPLTGVYFFPLPDGTFVHLELVLVSVATYEDTDKIRSANWSFAWINEATEVTAEVLGQVSARIGRYPSEQLGGCSYSGILMDFNRPPQGHWLMGLLKNPQLMLEGDDEPIDVAVFEQPPAAFEIVHPETGKVTYEVNNEAENLENLSGGTAYYKRQIALNLQNGREDLVRSLYCMMDVPVRDGKAVFPRFDPDIHVARVPLEPLTHSLVVVGVDTSGIHPAATFWQENQGKWCCLDELIGVEMGLEAFMEEGLVPLARERYATCPILVSCDPANARDSYTGLAPTVHLQRLGFQIHLPRTNDPKIRIRAVETLLNKQVGGIIISPTCKALVRAMNGAYHYAKRKVLGSIENAYSAKPEKNEASHIADAAQYAAMFITQGELQQRADVVNLPVTEKLRLKRSVLKTIIG